MATVQRQKRIEERKNVRKGGVDLSGMYLSWACWRHRMKKVGRTIEDITQHVWDVGTPVVFKTMSEMNAVRYGKITHNGYVRAECGEQKTVRKDVLEKLSAMIRQLDEKHKGFLYARTTLEEFIPMRAHKMVVEWCSVCGYENEIKGEENNCEV